MQFVCPGSRRPGRGGHRTARVAVARAASNSRDEPRAGPARSHMHPPLLKIMDECQEGLRYVFQTDSKYTLLVSGTGHAGMEAAIVNLLEPGETIVVGVAGIWGQRVADMAGRFGAKVVEMKAEEGRGFDKETIRKVGRPRAVQGCQSKSRPRTAPRPALTKGSAQQASRPHPPTPPVPAAAPGAAQARRALPVPGGVLYGRSPEPGGAGGDLPGERHAPSGGHGVLARRGAADGRRVGRRLHLLGVAKVPVRPARRRSVLFLGARHAEAPVPQDQGPVVQPGHDAHRRLLGLVQQAQLPPHGRRLHLLRHAGGPGDRQRGGRAGPVEAPRGDAPDAVGGARQGALPQACPVGRVAAGHVLRPVIWEGRTLGRCRARRWASSRT